MRNESEAYWSGYDDAMNNFLAENYGQRESIFSGHCGNSEEYEEGYKAGWTEADRIDALVE